MEWGSHRRRKRGRRPVGDGLRLGTAVIRFLQGPATISERPRARKKETEAPQPFSRHGKSEFSKAIFKKSSIQFEFEFKTRKYRDKYAAVCMNQHVPNPYDGF